MKFNLLSIRIFIIKFQNKWSPKFYIRYLILLNDIPNIILLFLLTSITVQIELVLWKQMKLKTEWILILEIILEHKYNFKKKL